MRLTLCGYYYAAKLRTIYLCISMCSLSKTNGLCLMSNNKHIQPYEANLQTFGYEWNLLVCVRKCMTGYRESARALEQKI